MPPPEPVPVPGRPPPRVRPGRGWLAERYKFAQSSRYAAFHDGKYSSAEGDVYHQLNDTIEHFQQRYSLPLTVVSTTYVPSESAYINVAANCIKGFYGNGETRRKKVTAMGYNYAKVQSLVNKYLKKGHF